MAARKLSGDEVAAMRALPLDAVATEDFPAVRDSLGGVYQYVIEMPDGAWEGHRFYSTAASVFRSADGKFEYSCFPTIHEHTMPFLVVVRDRRTQEVLGHYFAPYTDF
jgi:hypothetical protein